MDHNPDNHTMGFMYKNYHGEVEFREVIPRRFYYGTTSYYPQAQWLMEAFCCNRQADRTFSMAQIQHIGIQKANQ